MEQEVVTDGQAPDLVDALKHRKELETQYYDHIGVETDVLRESIVNLDRIDLLMSEVLSYQVKPCHMSMLKFQQSNDKTLVLAPRGIGKSISLTVVRSLFEVVKNPDIRILIVSNTQLQAEIFLREIKQHIEANDKFIDVFGDLVGAKWDSKEINVKTRKTFAKESTISCCGVGGAIIGRHYDLIIADDLVDEENSRTDLQRERFKVWFYKSLEPTLEPDGRMFVHGTRYYPSDFYGHLAKVDDSFISRVWPAINKNGESLWPEKMTLEWLLSKKKAMGTAIFNTQYQNDTTAMEGKIFKYEYIKFYDSLPDKIAVYQGVDLAVKKEENHDFFCIATIGKDEYGRVYLIDLFKDKLSFLQKTAKIIEKNNQYHPRRIFIESNAYQSVQGELVMHLSDAPVKPITTIKDKVTRAWTLSSKFENGDVYFPRWGVQDFIDSLIEFPDSDHDDDFDAFEIAVSWAFRKQKKSRRDFGVL